MKELIKADIKTVVLIALSASLLTLFTFWLVASTDESTKAQINHYEQLRSK